VVPAPEPLFLDTGTGPLGTRFAMYHAPQATPVRGMVVYVPPFAEEMNKSRRMAAMQARKLASRGHAVLQMDLLGCGDSAGDSGDAHWEAWVEDVLFAARWLKRRTTVLLPPGAAAPPLWLWGLRAGCLLAAAAAARLDEPCALAFWQPVADGKVMLRQFLRLKSAAAMLGAGGTGASIERLRADLAAGLTVDVAGYRLRPELALPLEAATLALPSSAQRAEWFEVSTRANGGLSPALATAAQRWAVGGCPVGTHVVTGPPFWQTTEIEDAPALVDATAAALDEASGAPRGEAAAHDSALAAP
jgi:exosortase A-associated hydrolase 2